MNSEAVGAIAEPIGAGGVIATLIYRADPAEHDLDAHAEHEQGAIDDVVFEGWELRMRESMAAPGTRACNRDRRRRQP